MKGRRPRVLVSDSQSDMRIDARAVVRAAQLALEINGASGTVSVVFLGRDQMRRLNRRWFRRNRLTDVIAFPLGGPCAPGDDLAGEVFVCPARALAQARESAENPAVEILRLVIHGVLHLLGRTDAAERDRREMLSEGDGILRRFLRADRAGRKAGDCRAPLSAKQGKHLTRRMPYI